MDRILLVSSDCHAAARPDDYLPYLEGRHHAAYREWAPGMRSGDESDRERSEAQYSADTTSEHFDNSATLGGGEAGYWNFERRIAELEADGVAAEVVFPNAYNPPFDAFPDTPGNPELRLAGARAYNRWLADRIDHAAGRQAGIALITLDDVEASVTEVQSAALAGLRGVLLPTGMHGQPLYNDARYERLWAACAEAKMPVHTHAMPASNLVSGTGGDAITRHEALWHTQRPFWCMVFGGVFDRHPGLRFVVTESGVEWIPELLRRMDIAFTGGRPTQKFTEHLELQPSMSGDRSPSQIWNEQCWAGASFMPKAETDMRHEIGVERLMWGSDYPHIEGTWPHTAEWLKSAFSGVRESEIRCMLGTNAVECYGFDAQRLAEVAARIGPPVDLIDAC
jgi:predicted TIM-barrel fold metal-dependent hydrolase